MHGGAVRAPALVPIVAELPGLIRQKGELPTRLPAWPPAAHGCRQLLGELTGSQNSEGSAFMGKQQLSYSILT